MTRQVKEIQSSGASPSDIWRIARKRLDSMSPSERTDTLKAAGILTGTGRVSTPYKGVIRNADGMGRRK